MTFGLFKGDRGKELLQNPAKQATIIVAKDGSGDTDDIHEAIKMLSAEGGLIQIRDGTYKINSTIDIAINNVSIFGSGFGTVLDAGLMNDKVIDISRISYFCILKDFKIIGDVTAGALQTGIYNSGGDGMLIQNVFIKNVGHQGIHHQGYDGRIINNFIQDCTHDGIEIAENRNIISHNYIDDSGNNGITLDGVDDVVCNNNIIKSSGNYNIGCEGIDNTTIIGNVLYNPTNANIDMDGNYRCVVVGNEIDNGDSGIIMDDMDESIVSNNHINSMDTYGIHIQADVSNSLITGNVVTRCTTTEILNQSGSAVVNNNLTFH